MTLLHWLRRTPRPHQVTLYSRPGCHLCEEARAILESLSRRHVLEITEIDIRGDPELVRRYDIRIPVIVIDDAVELEPPITSQLVRHALRGLG